MKDGCRSFDTQIERQGLQGFPKICRRNSEEERGVTFETCTFNGLLFYDSFREKGDIEKNMTEVKLCKIKIKTQ